MIDHKTRLSFTQWEFLKDILRLALPVMKPLSAVLLVLLVLLVVILTSRSYLREARHIEHIDMSDFVGTDDEHKGSLRVQYSKRDYFSFFKSLGIVSYLSQTQALNSGDQQIICGICFVKRETPVVRKEHRGKWLGMRLLLRGIPWALVSTWKIFGLTMGAGEARYLRPLRSFMGNIPVRFHVVPSNQVFLVTRCVRRYSDLNVVDRTGQKDIYLGDQKMNLLHLSPNTAPNQAHRCKLAKNEKRLLMILLLPNENIPQELSPPTLVGNLVHVGLGRPEDFEWFGSGDL